MTQKRINTNKEKVLPRMEAETTYANHTIVWHSDRDFLIDFVQSLPNQDESVCVSRIVMTPESIIDLCNEIDGQLSDYFGDDKEEEN